MALFTQIRSYHAFKVIDFLKKELYFNEV